MFLMETDFELRDTLIENSWVTTLAYLSGIFFNRFIDLNSS